MNTEEKHVLGLSGGKDSAALAVYMRQYYPELNPPKNAGYDFTVYIHFKIIDVSPEHIKESEFTESREIQDGWEYDLDPNGNVRKDSLGNDIKKPKYKTISCKVLETIQHKAAHIEGSVDYYDNSSGQILRSRPFAADHIFDYASYLANGDLKALSKETRKLVGTKPVPFPRNIDMIYGAAETCKQVVHGILMSNKRFVN